MDTETADAVKKLNLRLDTFERNMDLCVNYCREMAKVNLSVEAIARIEGELTNGHGEQ